jgi:hypothetical protein
VTVSDVLYMAPRVLSHRLMLESSVSAGDVVAQAAASVA